MMEPVFTGDVMVVEDNIVIAMDAEDLVRSLGAANVHGAASVEQAEAIMAHADLEAAILDYNLENETSEAVADSLVERGVPFAFATGYSGLGELPERFRNQVLLEKPYSDDDIRSAFAGRIRTAA